jgi:hypothetical protein
VQSFPLAYGTAQGRVGRRSAHDHHGVFGQVVKETVAGILAEGPECNKGDGG